ncbi:tRNA modification GTPase TrmE [Croceitalea dokdonensis DOKDO 023]|uniref:tRNA modification GTPase MnmE n=1 Tax=Croceitalea dokdonensis DOKDO 023 TaxID=1300341 RepID=A0A0P7AYB9_9FLAO|nr:tRNA uridine-5-carboxymethylaminomethyl(34) synthesis GTPase MnmE [Croceitalea dokdonensis]KPM33855.1 tRNA modification GTPase TrmE [Croceitalea dokdonensis DOKDO 023]
MMVNENIIALATPAGTGAIAVIRISGPDAITIVSSKFRSIGKKILKEQKSHTVHLGHIYDGPKILDKVLVTLFKAPNSYTGDHVVEISCHGSVYIQQQLIQLFLRNGCQMAKAGEFTLRAFLNGKMDLSQAEAVADLIASDSEASHQVAMQQMRGGFSLQINELRQELLNFASLIELELDFSGEDVEFADRTQFNTLLQTITGVLKNLIDSFALGNVIKNGIPVAIVGAPNVGKSTLLNALLNEDRAIVSNIPGTTRDTVEDQISIGGVNFRFIDTAGIRQTEDTVEKIGIEKSHQKIQEAALVLYLFDANTNKKKEISALQDKYPLKKILPVANKTDMVKADRLQELQDKIRGVHLLSAKQGDGLDALKKQLLTISNTGDIGKNDTIVTNNRHYDSLLKALEAIQRVKEGMQEELASDLMAIDIREALFHLGEITGAVSPDDLLGNIFSNFCIGK